MHSYWVSVGTAFLVFPLIAFLFTMPYILHQYRKYGSILFVKAAIIYSFILYLLIMFFLIILPLPSISYVKNLTTPKIQMIPFTFVSDFIRKSGFIWNQLSTYVPAIKSPSFYNVAFNMALFIPLGIYLRYYFDCSKRKTIGLAFLLSLFFELTQLSGLYGIYPRPYRLFDIDDLIVNTFGAFIGILITPFLSIILPSRKSLDKAAYEKGSRVTYFRRFVALLIDFFIFLSLFFLIHRYTIHIYLIFILFYFILIPTFTRGYTPGKWFVKIRITKENGDPPSFYQICMRNGLLHGIFLPAPFYILHMLSSPFPALTFSALGLGTSHILLLFYTFFKIMHKDRTFYEMYSKTKVISTIPPKIEIDSTIT